MVKTAKIFARKWRYLLVANGQVMDAEERSAVLCEHQFVEEDTIPSFPTRVLSSLQRKPEETACFLEDPCQWKHIKVKNHNVLDGFLSLSFHPIAD